MNILERVLAGILGLAALLIVVSLSWKLAEALPAPKTPIGAVFIGTGMATLFIIGVGYSLLAVRRASIPTVAFVVWVSVLWMLVLEPAIKLHAGLPYQIREWSAEAFVSLVIASPLLLNYLRTRKRKSNKDNSPDRDSATLHPVR